MARKKIKNTLEFITGSGLYLPSGAVEGHALGQNAQAGGPGFHAWRQVGGNNLLPNSSFEDGITGYSIYSSNLSPVPALISATPTLAKHGIKVARLTNSTDVVGDMGLVSDDYVPVVEGRYYAFSAEALGANALTWSVCIAWYTAANGLISTPSSTAVLLPGLYTRNTMVELAPATAAKAKVYVWFTNPASGEVIDVDCLQLEEGGIGTAYTPREDDGKEYALSTSGGSGVVVSLNTWTKLPFGALVAYSPDYAECLRWNADGTVTVLKSGWYTISNMIAFNALTVDIGVQFGIWTDATDTAPANPSAGWRTESTAGASGAPLFSNPATMYMAAGTRFGASAYVREAGRTVTAQAMSVARIGAGPSGPTGPPSDIRVQVDAPSDPQPGTIWVDTDAPVAYGPPLVTALPGSPVDGQECYYQNAAMAALGVAWHLRYRSAASGSYKWEYVGGPPYESHVDTSDTRSNSVYGALVSSPGPILVVPLAGDYIVDQSASMEAAITTGWRGRVSFTGADATALIGSNSGNAGGLAQGGSFNRRQIATLTASTYTTLYRSDASQMISFWFRSLSITPVRVG